MKKLFNEDNKNLTFLTETDFDIHASKDVYLNSNNGQFGMLFVYKDTCPFCVPLKKIINVLAKEFTNLDLPFYVANQTDGKYLYTVKTVPAFYFVNSDNKLHAMNPEKRTVYEILLSFISELTLANKNIMMASSNMMPSSNIMPSSNMMPSHKSIQLPNSLYNDSPKIVQLTHSDFIKNVTDNISLRNYKTPGILKAYANWCIFCKLKTGLLEELSNESKAISIYAIDLADDKDNPLNEIITGYPTFLLVDGSGHIHRIGNQETVSKILTDDKNISYEQRSELIYAINSVMN